MTDSYGSNFLDDPDFQSLLVTCLESLQRGETIDRESLERDFPKYASDVGQFLEDRQLLEQVAADFGDVEPSQIAIDAYEKTLASNPRSDDYSIGESIRYIGEYEILDEIARGGMGVVFKARQTTLKRIVALKMILAGRLADASDVERFQREARAAGRLKHPNIVPVHEIGEHDGRHYFTMDFVDGQSLADSIREETLAPRAAAELVRAAAEAVQYAHSEGTVHRDLKPANVLIDTAGQPQITDFGLAKLLESVDEESRAELTASGQILGTPSYMSPEQAAGKQELVGPASDIYSLGAILYACLTGRAPFVADSPVDTLLQVMRKEPVSPRLLTSTVPKDLETICLKCLNKEPHGRYASAQELADDLQRFLDGRPIVARPVGIVTRLAKWARRRPGLAATLAIAFMATTLLLAVWVSMTLRLREHRDFAIAQFQQRHKQLVNARLQEAAALRVAGNRTAALEAIRSVRLRPEIQADETSLLTEWMDSGVNIRMPGSEWERSVEQELRTEAIQTLVSPGLELVHDIPFGEVYEVRISPDSRYLAACGEYSFGMQAATMGEANGQYRTSLVVWELATGKQVAEKLIGPGGYSTQHSEPQSQAVREISRNTFEFLPGADHLIAVNFRSDRDDYGKFAIWNPITDETLREFSGPVAVTTDGQYLAAFREGEWTIEENQTESTVGTITSGPIYGILPSNLAVHTQSFQVTDIATGEAAWTHSGSRSLRPLLVGPRAELFVAKPWASSSETITIRRVQDGSEVAQLPHVRTAGKRGGVTPYHFRFSPEGKRLAYQTDLSPDVVGIWSLERNQPEALLPGSLAFDFGRTGKTQFSSFSPDGRLLAIFAHAESSAMKIWDLEKREAVCVVEVFDPNWSADGRWLVGQFDPGEKLPGEPSNPGSAYSSSHGRVIKAWRVHQPPPRIQLPESVHTLQFSPGGDRLIANGELRSFQDGNVVTASGDSSLPGPAALPTGRVQAEAVRFDAQDRVWRFQLPKTPFHEEPLAATSSERTDWQTFPVPDFTGERKWFGRSGDSEEPDTRVSDVTISPEMLVLSADGSRLTVAAQISRKHTPKMRGYGTSFSELALLRYALTKDAPPVINEAATAHDWGYGLQQLAVSPHGELIATAHSHRLKIRRWSDGEELGHTEVASRWTSDEDLASGWDQKSGSEGRWEYANLFAIRCLAFSPDSQRVIVGAEKGRMIIVDASANVLTDWQAHDAEVTAVVVHPSLEMLTSGDAKGRIRLWNIGIFRQSSAPALLADWSAHTEAVTALTFHPDGKHLVSGSTSGEVTVWDLQRIRDGLNSLQLAWQEPKSFDE